MVQNALPIRPQLFGGAIGGTVINQYHFDVRVALNQKTLHALCYESAGVVGRNDHRNQREAHGVGRTPFATHMPDAGPIGDLILLTKENDLEALLATTLARRHTPESCKLHQRDGGSSAVSCGAVFRRIRRPRSRNGLGEPKAAGVS